VTEELPGHITDPRALRALSHPTRWKLIELLRLETTATATRCAEFTGESVASCSYHLGILAKYGFVEPVEGNHGREKPWRALSRRFSIDTEGLDPETALAAETASEVFLDHELGRMKEFLRRSDREPAPWRQRDATGYYAYTTFLTAEELTELSAQIRALIDRYNVRADPATRPEGARAVRLAVFRYLPLPGNLPVPAAHYSESHEEVS
jgi:hypothetical protein